MNDCTSSCAALGTDCDDCEQTSNPAELPTRYRPRPMTPFHAAACRLVAESAAECKTCPPEVA